MKYPEELEDINLREKLSNYNGDYVDFAFCDGSVDVSVTTEGASYVQLDYKSVKKLHKKLGKWLKRVEHHYLEEVGE